MMEKNMRTFLAIWATQMLSALSSTMTAFAVSVWVYQSTGSATIMAGTITFFMAPFIISSIFAGPIIDKYKRKYTLAVSDTAAMLGTLGILASFLAGKPSLPVIYAAAILNGVGGAFQWPAFSATISLMIPKEQRSRVNGLMSIKDAGPGIVGPIIAGALYPILGLPVILLVDVVTCVLAVAVILMLPIPSPTESRTGQSTKRQNIFKQAAFGFVYIFKRPALLAIQLFFLVANLFSGMALAMVIPLVLAKTGGNATSLGSVQSASAIGMLLGGLLMASWKGFRKKTNGILLGGFIMCLFGQVCFGFAVSVPLLIAFALLGGLGGPVANASNQSIWQDAVPQDLQGRVFSARRLIAWITQPLAPVLAGLLADAVFEPAMRDAASPLGRLFGPVFGNASGSGIGLLVTSGGFVVLLIVLCYLFIPSFNNAEARLEEALKAEAVAEGAS